MIFVTMHNIVTYHVLRCMLGYIDDQQLYHKCHLMTLGATIILIVELKPTFRLRPEPRSIEAMRTLYGVLTNVALIYRRMRSIDTQ